MRQGSEESQSDFRGKSTWAFAVKDELPSGVRQRGEGGFLPLCLLRLCEMLSFIDSVEKHARFRLKGVLAVGLR